MKYIHHQKAFQLLEEDVNAKQKSAFVVNTIRISSFQLNFCFNVASYLYLYIQVKCHSLIIATGATAKRLRLPREDDFWSRGISACAICDGASPLFKGQVLAVVGGGDTATEEALYLTKYARHVHLLVRKSQLRASKAMQDR